MEKKEKSLKEMNENIQRCIKIMGESGSKVIVEINKKLLKLRGY